MSAPKKHNPILSPPRIGMEKDSREMFKFLYELWKRTGEYSSDIRDFSGLEASVGELNTLVGVRTDERVQTQLDLKANTSDLGTMAFQNATAVSISGGTINSTTINGGLISNTSVINSSVTIPAGSSINTATAGGVLNVDTSATGNTGATETTLLSYSLLANSLNTDQSLIKIAGWGTFAANGNNKRIRIKIGSTTLVDTTALAVNDGVWSFSGMILRKTDSSGAAIIDLLSSNVTLPSRPYYASFSESFTADLNVFFTGEASANDDIVQEGFTVEWCQQ